MTVSQDVKYVGVTDRKTDLFEGQYRIPTGISYNSYLILDEKIAVFDTVDVGFFDEWIANVKSSLSGVLPDYLIIQHMEPDHSANIVKFINEYPSVKLVASKKAFSMMSAFFGVNLEEKGIIVKEGDTLSLGEHNLTFIGAPMVHWPEVILTYESKEKILFSADAFGKFGTPDSDEPWEDEARRYFIGIVGKYGAQVQSVLKKAAGLDIQTICPLHGPVIKENLAHYISLYDTWSSYRPEREGVLIAYTSVYGNTKKAVSELLEMLKEKGKEAEALDLARCDMSYAVSEAFKYDTLVLATTTYNAGIFPFMHSFINHLTERNFQNRTVALIENGSWAPTAAKVMRGMLEECKNINILDSTVTIISAPNEKTRSELSSLLEKLI